MDERTSFSNMGEENYKLDGRVEFRGVKNYSIRQSVEYRVIKSYQLKYHVHCLQAAMAVHGVSVLPFDKTLDISEFKEVRRIGGVHNRLALTLSQDHRQLDSSLICKFILPLIQSNSFKG
ncbi:hypothetical protein Ahy_A03g014273 [Arachis hypogaea]|uniref:Uncharacterized protein n=1 Tax=Arachis hypogaea TaxID=3818 RepID=A0A445DXA9_ARAHY|nr:hypothetical protein Ahy_A03g014273 [Arachis hypogaea]